MPSSSIPTSGSGASRDRTPTSPAGFTPTGAPDPFYARLAELLPDIDIVVLPPELAAPATENLGVADAQRAAADGADRALATLRRWWPVVIPDLAAPAKISTVWSPGTDGHHVRAKASARTTLAHEHDRRRVVARAREHAVAAGATILLERASVGLLRLRADKVTIDLFVPADVRWLSVSASVPDIAVGTLAVALTTNSPTETPWKQRDG